MGIGDIFKIKQFKTEIEQLKTENQNLLNDNQNMHQQLQELGAFDYYKILDMTEQLKKEYEAKKLTAQEDFQKHLDSIDKSIAEKNSECQNILNQLEELRSQEVKLNKNVKTQTNKLNKSKELVKAINYTFDKYLNYEPSQSTLRFPENQLSELEEISPSVILKLHCMDIKDLRKAYRLNDKQMLNQKRVNKVNMRKEFFNVTIDELEELVTEIEPTAEFNRTMAAEEYRQSLSTTENYSKNYVDTDEDDEELE